MAIEQYANEMGKLLPVSIRSRQLGDSAPDTSAKQIFKKGGIGQTWFEAICYKGKTNEELLLDICADGGRPSISPRHLTG